MIAKRRIALSQLVLILNFGQQKALGTQYQGLSA